MHGSNAIRSLRIHRGVAFCLCNHVLVSTILKVLRQQSTLAPSHQVKKNVMVSLNQPLKLEKVDSGGREWGGKRTKSNFSLINGSSANKYDLPNPKFLRIASRSRADGWTEIIGRIQAVAMKGSYAVWVTGFIVCAAGWVVGI